MTATDTNITKIAREHLQLNTLEPRGRDSLDFHELGVEQIKRALNAAYEAGRAGAGEGLVDAIRESLSPQTVALIAAKCQPSYGRGEVGQTAEREVAWFTERLIEMLGASEYDRLCNELGV